MNGRFVPPAIALTALFVFAAGASAAEPLEVPVTVHEALVKGAKGVDRKGEPVKLGLPFTDEMAVKEKDGRPALKVEGAAVWQTRTLAKWPSGNVRWALLDFQSDCAPNAMAAGAKVVPGEGSGGGAALAAEDAETITVDTGAMKAVVRKKGFNLLDKVTVGGTEIVAGGSPGVVCVGADGTVYSAAEDAKAEVKIEENGPARCVVLAVGTHRKGEKRMLDFTVRMHFYKGKTGVRVFYTLRNASSDQQELATIKDAGLALKLKIDGGAAFQAAKHDGTVKGELAGGEAALYLQRMSSFPNVGRVKGTPGYAITKGAEKLAGSDDAKSFPDVAWMDLAGKDGAGATASLRYAAGYWPTALRGSGDGALSVSPWPAETGDHKIPFPTHNTREIWFDFHAAAAADPAGSAFRFQYPLAAKGSVEWYNRCQNDLDIYPLYHFVSRGDEVEFAKKQGWPNNQEWRRSKLKLWSYWYWGLGGFENQHDFARTDLVDFLRDTADLGRAGEYFLAAEARLNYNADYSTPHSDGPKPVTKQFGLQKKTTFEWEHRQWYGMPLFYYLTGDERFGDVSRGYAKMMKEGTNGMNQCVNLSYTYQRVLGWGMYTLGVCYDLSDDHDQKYVELIRTNGEKLFTGKEVLTVEWQRGGLFGGSGSGHGGGRDCKPFLMLGYILHDGFWNAARNLPEGDPLRERIEDAIEGIDWLMARECFYFTGDSGITGKSDRKLWCPYVYDLDSATPPDQGYCLPGEAGYSVALPMERFGEEFRKDLTMTYLRACFEVKDNWAGYSYICHPGVQATLWRAMNPKQDRTPPEAAKDLKAEALAGGQVKLTWTVPAGEAVRCQVKHSDKKIVPNLNFDRDKRTWEFDPKDYAAWWAAENVPGEPAPEAAGRSQSMTVKDIPAGKRIFAIRFWDAARNRSAVSNLAEVEVK